MNVDKVFEIVMINEKDQFIDYIISVKIVEEIFFDIFFIFEDISYIVFYYSYC